MGAVHPMTGRVLLYEPIVALAEEQAVGDVSPARAGTMCPLAEARRLSPTRYPLPATCGHRPAIAGPGVGENRVVAIDP